MAHIFEVRSEFTRLGRNSEMADYDNPEGFIYGYLAYVYFENDRGERFAYLPSMTNDRTEVVAQEKAESFLDEAAVADINDPKLWSTLEPRYGSEAYESQEARGWYEREFEDEQGFHGF